MDFRILGPLEASDEGVPVALGGSKQRALLALLLLRANETISTDRLIDELWGDAPPATAAKTIQVHVHRLRRALAGNGGGAASDVLVTREHGYELRVDSDHVDARRFERLLDAARAASASGDPQAALAASERALALWRGRPLGDLADEPFARHEIDRLDDLRVATVEQLIDAKLALARHAEVVGELEGLIDEHPYREGLRAQLMLALYRCDRQAEALQAYQDARRVLVGELGIEPGARLRELERAILAQDAALALAVPQPVATPETKPGERPPSEARPAPAATRRLVSIVFADLVGSTGLAERLDPETMHSLLDRYTECCGAVIERHGGSVEGFIGDAVVGVFGQDEVHEDDALRAVRVAVEMRREGAELSADLERGLGFGIGMKFGVESGEVFVSRGSRRSPFAAGDAFNVAARLEGLASEGQILLGAAIYELVKGSVRVQALERLKLKGRTAKVQAWQLLELTDDQVGLGPDAKPLVGREHELGELRKALADACEEPGCRAMTLVGPAGIGKSRLARELRVETAGDATVVVGRCLSYGEDATYRPLAEIVQQICGADPRDGIEDLLDGDESRVNLVLQAIGLSAGAAQVEETFWAVRSLFERAADERPLVMVVDDVHWAEPALLDLLDYLVAFSRGHPILLLCLSRPELAETRPSWLAPQQNRSLLVVDPLSDAEARLLIESAAPEALGSNAEARIVDMAEGNPLFLEQLVAVGVEDQASALPSSIQAVLAARIDRLDEAERAVLEHASVQGRSFSVNAVAELLPEYDRAGIAMLVVSLVRKQLVRPDRADVGGDDAFRFAHVLIREVAYQRLPKGRRAELHERLAGWLAASPEARDDIIGFHLSEAYENLAALGPVGDRERAVATAAVERLTAAADAARLRGDPAAGARLLERAQVVLASDARARGELLPLLGATLYDAGRLGDAARVLDEAIGRASEPRLLARAQIERELVRLETDLDTGTARADRVAEEVLPVLDREDDHHGASRAWFLRGEVAWIAGRVADADDSWMRAAEQAGRAGAERERFELIGWRAMAAAQGPAPINEAITRCEEFGVLVERSPIATVWILQPLALLHAMKGELETAERLLAEANEIRHALGGLGSSFSHLEAGCRLCAHQPELAEARLRTDAEKLSSMRGKGTLATTLALLARAVYAQGRTDEAAELCASASREAAPEDTMTQVIWRGVLARVAASQGRHDEAESLSSEAVGLATPTDLISLRGDAMLDRADVLWVGERLEEADRSARAGIALYEAKGNVAAASEALALLSH
jgi:DNA-binding SARP family transcriptional activator/tetratricopeptide (TPR) repeat protein